MALRIIHTIEPIVFECPGLLCVIGSGSSTSLLYALESIGGCRAGLSAIKAGELGEFEKLLKGKIILALISVLAKDFSCCRKPGRIFGIAAGLLGDGFLGGFIRVLQERRTTFSILSASSSRSIILRAAMSSL